MGRGRKTGNGWGNGWRRVEKLGFPMSGRLTKYLVSSVVVSNRTCNNWMFWFRILQDVLGSGVGALLWPVVTAGFFVILKLVFIVLWCFLSLSNGILPFLILLSISDGSFCHF